MGRTHRPVLAIDVHVSTKDRRQRGLEKGVNSHIIQLACVVLRYKRIVLLTVDNLSSLPSFSSRNKDLIH